MWCGFLIAVFAFAGISSVSAEIASHNLRIEARLAEIRVMNLEELLNVKIEVSANKPTTNRESPGVLTVITREQILDSGSRDLIDVFSLLLPGFQFAHETQGTVGAGFRGQWGLEGKILVLLDGIEINEEMYGTVVFGNRFSVDSIDRIEVIRGPGSAMYGGYAGLAVINIISRDPCKGDYLVFRNSQMEKTYSHRNVTMGYGQVYGDSKISLTGLFGQGNRSDRTYVDYGGNGISMVGNQRLDPQSLNFHYSNKEFDLRYMAEDYWMTQVDLWGFNTQTGPIPQSFRSRLLQVKYDLQVSPRVCITPRYLRKEQKAWTMELNDGPEAYWYSNNELVEKDLLGFNGLWDINDRSNLAFGFEHSETRLYAPDNPVWYEKTLENGSSMIRTMNDATFAQVSHRARIGMLTFGGRYDHSPKFGSSFTPRTGFNRSWGKFNLKAGWSRSFRSPDANEPENLRPELGTISELEFGYKLSPSTFVNLNLFDMLFEKVIVYQIDGSYLNAGRIRTKGFEMELKKRTDHFKADLNFAWYRATENTIESFRTPLDDDSTAAFPQNRFNGLLGFRLAKDLWIHPSVSYYGTRYAYYRGGYEILEDGTPEVLSNQARRFDPTIVCNINLRKTDLWVKGLSFDVGISDIGASGFSFIAPYQGIMAPLPAPSRTINCRIELEREF